MDGLPKELLLHIYPYACYEFPLVCRATRNAAWTHRHNFPLRAVRPPSVPMCSGELNMAWNEAWTVRRHVTHTIAGRVIQWATNTIYRLHNKLGSDKLSWTSLNVDIADRRRHVLMLEHMRYVRDCAIVWDRKYLAGSYCPRVDASEAWARVESPTALYDYPPMSLPEIGRKI